MRDEESLSLWDHITGECFEGSLEGQKMTFWGVDMTTVEAELTNYPEVILLKSPGIPFLKSTAMNTFTGTTFIDRQKFRLLPFFRRSMNGEIDSRLPEGENGLGVMDETHNAKYYPMSAIPKGGSIEDEWLGRQLIVERGPIDGVPKARWADAADDDDKPMQLLSRWYGFAFTYPDCEIYGQ